MEASQVLVFRDYSGWDEPALSTPFGFISIRNVIVMALFGALAALLYGIFVPERMDPVRDWPVICLSLLPLAAGVILGMVRTPFSSADAVLLCMIALRLAGRPPRERGRSSVLGFPRRIRGRSPTGEIIQEIVCADLDELKSVRIALHGGDGTVLANSLVKCYLDNELIDTLMTSAEGTVVLHLRPEREGDRTLVIRSHRDGTVMLRKPIRFAVRACRSRGAVARE